MSVLRAWGFGIFGCQAPGFPMFTLSPLFKLKTVLKIFRWIQNDKNNSYTQFVKVPTSKNKRYS